jgi:hypothetical protein
MRRFLSLLSWVLLPLVAIIVLAIMAGAPPRSSAPLPVDKNREPLPTSAAFAGFPLDTPRTIDFDLDENTMNQLTPRERVDQIRDWLLYTVVVDSGASADTINRSLYDLAPIRHGYLRHVSRFEYGTTRSCVLGDNQVIALVPEADPRRRADDLAHIFDEARKNLGAVPGELIVFEYSLDTPDKATVTRRAAVPGHAFLETAAGYQEASVKSVADLEKFMTSVDDLVFARNEADVLKLGGRKLANTQYRNIRVEDVAAIWQAEEKIHADLRDFEAKWDRRLKEFNSTWRSSHRGASDAQYRKAFQEELQQPHDEEQAELRLVETSGFSLDPAYDYSGLSAALAKPKLADLVDLLLSGKGIDAEIASAVLIKTKSARITTLSALLKAAHVPESMLGKTIAALEGQPVPADPLQLPVAGLGGGPTSKHQDSKKPDELPFLRLKKVCEDRGRDRDHTAAIATELLRRLNTLYRFQAARYDGPLNGTEVGMVLYYTDLLAKIWGQDFAHSTPSSAIAGFEPKTRFPLPTIYRAELIELPNTRLWFGPEDNGYQIVDRSTLHFARNATRIYSASSNPLEPGREVAPNAPSEAFLSWWNDHYEEVAQYEPEYQRLNQIMKWSLLVGWLNGSDASERLGLLRSVPVDHSAWFPDWVRKSPQLRFHDWDRIRFFPKGHLGTTTEAMPILVSYGFDVFADEVDQAWHIEGGVSLASKETLHARPVLQSEVPALMRRSGLDYGKALHNADQLVTFRGTQYTFSAWEKGATARLDGIGREVATLKMTAKSGLKYRARFGEMREGQFERIVERTGSSARIEGRTAVGEIGHLNVAPSRNGFREGWRAREMDDGYTIARSLSSRKDFAQALRSDPLVEAAIADETGAFYVKSQGSRKWIKVAAEGEPSPDLASGWHARVADIVPDAQPVNIVWVDESELPAELKSGGNWIRGPPRRSGRISGLGGEPPGPNIQEATAAILQDPRAYKLELDARFKQNLDEIDQLLAADQPRKALAIIEENLGEFGGHEQLRFRQALAELADRRPDAAADAVNNIKFANQDQAVLLIDEVNGRLKKTMDPEMYRIAESADWRTTSSKPSGDEVLLTTKDGTLGHELRLKQAPEGLPVKSDAVPADARIYVQDTPELNTLDWNTSVKASLDQVAGLDLGYVIELPRADIAHFDPAYISSPKARFSRAGKFAPGRFESTYRVWTGANSGGDDGDDDEKDENGLPRHRKGKVFLVVARTAAS